MTRLCVGVFCSASRAIPGHYVELAARMGAGIAQRGWDLVSGGENVSMMGAVAAAARAGGAHTLGVVTRRLLGKADLESDELIVTESMGERKARMVASAHVLLVLPGGIGTCEELFEAWTGHILGVHAKPIVILDEGGYFSGLLSWLGGVGERGFASRSALDVVIRASNVAHALDACAGAGLLSGTPVIGTPLTGMPVAGMPVAGTPLVGASVTGTPVTGALVAGAPLVGASVTGMPVTSTAGSGMRRAGTLA